MNARIRPLGNRLRFAVLIVLFPLLLVAPAVHGEGRYRTGIDHALQQLDTALSLYRQNRAAEAYHHLESVRTFAGTIGSETRKVQQNAAREQAICLDRIAEYSGAVADFRSRSIDAAKVRDGVAGNLFSLLEQEYQWEKALGDITFERQTKQRELQELENLDGHLFGKLVLLFQNRAGRIPTLKDDIRLLDERAGRLSGLLAESGRQSAALKSEMESANQKYRKYTYMYNVLHEKNGELKAVNDFLNKSLAFWSGFEHLSQSDVADQMLQLYALLDIEAAVPGQATRATGNRMVALRLALQTFGDKLDAGENFMQTGSCQ